MRDLTINDAYDVLSLYEISESVSKITIIESSTGSNKIRIIFCIETDSGREYICRISNEANYPKGLVEKQCAFARFLYDNGINTPKKYSCSGGYCRTLKINNEYFLVVLEERLGNDMVLVTPEEYRDLGILLGKIHCLSEGYVLKVGQGIVSRSIDTGRARFDNLIKQLMPPVCELISALQKDMHRLPYGTVHGDLSSFNNIVSMPDQKGMAVIDFNLAGEEPYLFDLLITFYSSINDLLRSSKNVSVERYFTFFEGYSSVRKFNNIELELWDRAAALFDGLYFCKRMIGEYNLSPTTDNAQWLYEALEHFDVKTHRIEKRTYK